MTRYSLSSDSRRWWWPAGLAGATGTAAVATLFVLAAAQGSSASERDIERSGGAGGTTSHSVPVEVPCFVQPLDWNTSLDGPIPTCTLYLRH